LEEQQGIATSCPLTTGDGHVMPLNNRGWPRHAPSAASGDKKKPTSTSRRALSNSPAAFYKRAGPSAQGAESQTLSLSENAPPRPTCAMALPQGLTNTWLRLLLTKSDKTHEQRVQGAFRHFLNKLFTQDLDCAITSACHNICQEDGAVRALIGSCS
jgi:hypothetical protein